MYYTMNVSLNYFRKHVSKNIFSENIIKFYGGTNEMAISKDMIIADLIALDPNYAAIWNGMRWMPIISGRKH